MRPLTPMESADRLPMGFATPKATIEVSDRLPFLRQSTDLGSRLAELPSFARQRSGGANFPPAESWQHCRAETVDEKPVQQRAHLLVAGPRCQLDDRFVQDFRCQHIPVSGGPAPLRVHAPDRSIQAEGGIGNSASAPRPPAICSSLTFRGTGTTARRCCPLRTQGTDLPLAKIIRPELLQGAQQAVRIPDDAPDCMCRA